MLAQALALHQQAFGAVHHFAVAQFQARAVQFGEQGLFMFEAGHGHRQDRVNALRRQTRHDVGGHAGGYGVVDMLGVAVVGEHDDGSALIACGHDHMLQRIAGIALRVDDHHVRLQLRQAFRQKHIGRQSGYEVVAGFQQTNAQ